MLRSYEKVDPKVLMLRYRHGHSSAAYWEIPEAHFEVNAHDGYGNSRYRRALAKLVVALEMDDRRYSYNHPLSYESFDDSRRRDLERWVEFHLKLTNVSSPGSVRYLVYVLELPTRIGLISSIFRVNNNEGELPGYAWFAAQDLCCWRAEVVARMMGQGACILNLPRADRLYITYCDPTRKLPMELPLTISMQLHSESPFQYTRMQKVGKPLFPLDVGVIPGKAISQFKTGVQHFDMCFVCPTHDTECIYKDTMHTTCVCQSNCRWYRYGGGSPFPYDCHNRGCIQKCELQDRHVKCKHGAHWWPRHFQDFVPQALVMSRRTRPSSPTRLDELAPDLNSHAEPGTASVRRTSLPATGAVETTELTLATIGFYTFPARPLAITDVANDVLGSKYLSDSKLAEMRLTSLAAHTPPSGVAPCAPLYPTIMGRVCKVRTSLDIPRLTQL